MAAVVVSRRDQSLENALNDFRAVLTQDQRHDLDAVRHVPDTHAVLIFTAELDAKRRTMKGHSIASRLYSVLQCVRDFSAVVDTFVSSKPEIAALVWGSIKLTMMVAVNFLSYFEVLTQLFMDLGRISPQFDQYQVLFPDSRGVQTALCDFHAAVVRCCQHVILAIRRPWHNQLFNSLWKSLEQEFCPDMEEIKNQRDRVDRELELARTQAALRSQQLQLDEQAEAGTFRGTMRWISGQTNDGVKGLREQLSRQRAREQKKQLLDALSTHDYVSPHRQNCKKRHSDTVHWFFQTQEFERWMSGDSQTLWCSGKIGSGKTVLTSGVVDHIFTERYDPRKPVTFFYPRFNEQDSLRSETILRSIARQAIESASIVDDTLPLLALLSRNNLATNALMELITKAVEAVDRLYIIIDGIDECEPAERRDLLKSLASLVAQNQGVRLFLATRETVSSEIRRAFDSYEQVSMGCSSGQCDISTYVTSTINALVDSEDLVVTDPSLVDDIKEALIKHADGMFLWAAFQLAEICSKANDEEIRNAIKSENLPKDLTEVFNRALSRVISSGKGDVALKLLPWITAAARPMSLDELQESAMIEIGQLFSMPERKINGICRISSWFQGLVDVDEETKTVSFAHISIRLFFLGDLKEDLKRFKIDADEADHYIGEICLTYLFFSDFQTTLAKRTRNGPAIQPMDLAWRAVGDNWTLPFGLGPLDQRGRRPKSANKAVAVKMDINETLVSFVRADRDNALGKFQASHPFIMYASSNCFFHTRAFSSSETKTWSLFNHIIQHGHELVTLPWKPNSDDDLDFLAMMDWACNVVHAPVLGFIIARDAITARDKGKMLPRPDLAEFLETVDLWVPKDTSNGTIELVWHISNGGYGAALGVLLDLVDSELRRSIQMLSLFVSIILGQAKLVKQLLPPVYNGGGGLGVDQGFTFAALIGDVQVTEVFLDAWSTKKGYEYTLEQAVYAAAERGRIRVLGLFLERLELSADCRREAQVIAMDREHQEAYDVLARGKM
ncbi:hypothetical protein F66182_2258 [Fusarium sp. NRRL 66182]|nr:hypothetical protein F66182_2258 [Fusarium sp. NRRL 66182]